MAENMKIIEALKEMHLIEKKMVTNQARITEYSALLSTERPMFATEEEQKKQLNALIQSNEDLNKRLTYLKTKVDATNLLIKIDFMGQKRSINELILIRRKLAKAMENTYHALSSKQAEQRKVRVNDPNAQIVRLWDEKVKNENLDKWMQAPESIDSRLEVVNATTLLVDDETLVKIGIL